MSYYDDNADKELAEFIAKMKEEGFGPDEIYHDPKGILGYMTGLCGCGTGEDFDLLWDVLDWCDNNDDPVVRASVKNGCYCSPAWELAAKVLDKANLVEHGSGIGWAWTTALGKGLLKWKKAVDANINCLSQENSR